MNRTYFRATASVLMILSAGRVAGVDAVLLQPSSSTPALTFTPFKSSGIYAVGEKVGWTVVAAAPAAAAPEVRYGYSVRRNNAVPIHNGPLVFSDGKATIETSLDRPGMVYVEITSSEAASRPIALGAAVDPARLQPAVPRPPDFDAFWDGKLQQLAQVPADPQVVRAESAVAGVELYTVTLNSLNSKAHGYLAKPARTGKFPALVIYQYAGVYALQPRTAADRAVEGWLTFNVSSHDMPPDQPKGAPANYQAVGNISRETSYFLNMYLRDARAIDYIASRPDWDGKTIVVMGTSMGGQQSLVTAALRPQVTAVIVNEPAGADSNGDLHGRKAGYPNWPSTDPQIMQTALYFDIVNFAPRIKAPALVAIGFIDRITPPVGIWTAFNQMAGPKEYVAMVESDHNNLTPQKQGAYERRWREVLADILAGRGFEPILPAQDGLRELQWQVVWADEFERPGPPDPAKWSYETGGSGWGNRELQFYTENRAENARVENGRLIIEARREDWQGRSYTSARLNSRQAWKYGRIEARARLPRGRGTWPAVWMLPAAGTYGKGGWPDNGEIDIIEHVGFEPGVIHGTVHTRAYNHVARTQRGAQTIVSDAQDAFHVYAVEWTPAAITAFVDGTRYFTFANERLTNPQADWRHWPFDTDFKLLVNLAVGGNWGGQKGVDESIWPQRLELDYVRVLQRK
jgi:cephalosporin-C deacetylase